MNDLFGPAPQVDTYYRGYRLSSTRGGVVIWYHADRLEVVESTAIAHTLIDEWLEAK